MSETVVTVAENTALKIYAEVTDGQLSVLQIGRGCLDRQRHGEVVESLRATINEALRRHGDDSLAALLADARPDELEPPEVRAFREQALEQARLTLAQPGAEPTSTSDEGFPETAVGTSDGGGRAVLRLGVLTVLEFPAELLDEPSTAPAERAVRDAVNAALTQQGDQLGELSVDPAEQQPSPSWEELGRQIGRIQKGLL